MIEYRVMDKVKNERGTNNQQPRSFEQLLDEYDYERPKRGQILEGRVVHVDDDMILVDVGAKRDAVVPRKDLSFLDKEMRDNIAPGDRLPVYVIRPSAPNGSDLLVSIARGREQVDWERAKAALAKGDVVELKVVGVNRGGLEVKFGRLRGFVPDSHTPGLRRGMTPEQRRAHKQDQLNTHMLLKVLEVDRQQRRLVLSGRAASRERRRRALEEIEVGQVIHGRVVGLADFGAFVDLGEVDGLVHVSELAWARVEHPRDVVKVGDEIDVQVKSVDVERERVGLSRKALLSNPWTSIEERWHVDDLVEGVVTNAVNFGAFVALPDGIEGLIPNAEMGMVGPATSKDVLQAGDHLLVRIISIDPAQARMDFSLRRVTPEDYAAWLEKQQTDVIEAAGTALPSDATEHPLTGEPAAEIDRPDDGDVSAAIV